MSDARATLQPLVGEWSWRSSRPAQDRPADAARHRARAPRGSGSATASSCVQRWSVPIEEAPDGLAVIGWDDERATYLQHYFDDRGVVRVYELSLVDGVLTLERTRADYSPLHFSQRYVGDPERGWSHDRRRLAHRPRPHDVGEGLRPGLHARRRDVAGDRGGRGDVERVDVGRHRDDRAPVGGLLPARATGRGPPSRAPGPPGRPRRRPPRRAWRPVASVSATVVKPSALNDGSASYQSGSRVHGQGEDRAHGDLDRAAVERVGAARRQQDGVEPERRTAAEDRADVGVVDDVLEHQHRARARRGPPRRRAAGGARARPARRGARGSR